MARNFVAVSLFACLSLAFGSPAIDVRISGGYEARDNQFPYQAAIYIDSSKEVLNDPLDDTFCSGSLISENYVLTAAHCLAYANQVTVVVGGTHLDVLAPNQVKQDSSDFIIPEDYKSGEYVWDIGLIKLSTPVEFADNIQPVKLAEDDGSHAGDVVLFAGWGGTSQVQYTPEPVLRWTESVILSYNQCTKHNQWYKQIVDEEVHMCQYTENKKSACKGDSGAPLVLDGVQIGVVAYTPGNCFKDQPVVHVKVGSYIDWIKENADL